MEGEGGKERGAGGGWTEGLEGQGGAGQESRAAVGRPVGLWYGLAGSSPMTDGDGKNSVPEPMRFGAGVKQLTQRQRGETGEGGSGEHGGLGPGAVLRNMDMLFVCTVQDGSHWPCVAVVQRSTACVARVPSLGNLI